MTPVTTPAELAAFCPPLGWQADIIGAPYDFKGFTRDALSCWGFCCLAWREQADVILPTFQADLPADPEFSTSRVRAVNAVIAEGVELMENIPQPRPMCFVQMRRGKFLTHIGLYAFGGWVVHADEDANGGTGAVVQEPIANLARCITGYFWPSDALLTGPASKARAAA